jgi:DNA-binding transcriptional LysR family regulator
VELRHLRYFVAVAETRHFGRAAARLHLAQPALSQSVRQLEAELGAPLLLRTTRQVSLTPAGEFFLEQARGVLTAVEDGARGVGRIAEGRLGLVRIAFTGTAAFSQLPRIARLVKQELPGVALEIHADLLTPAQTEGLLAGRLDLGVLRLPVGTDRLAVRTLAVEHLGLALPADHPLTTEPAVALPDLRREDFITYAEDHSAVNEALHRTCREAGFAPRVEHRAPGTAVLLALVAAGLGVSLVPESVRALPLAGVVFRDVAGTALTELGLARRADDDSPLVTRVLEVLEADGLFLDGPADRPAPTEVPR